MFQDYALFPHLTVTQNIGFGLRNGTRDGEWIGRVLADMHLAHLGERYPHTLSGGQQQRIALLRALAPAPGILLLDEPFSGLDEHLRQRVRQETRAILAESGVTTLMVTHNPEAAMFLADRIVVLNDGRVAQDATPVEIYTAPADPFIVRLFGPANEFAGVVRDGALDTALGPIRVAGIENGTRALCLVRADGVEVTAAPPSWRWRVRSRAGGNRASARTDELPAADTHRGRDVRPPAGGNRGAAARHPRTGDWQRGLGARMRGADIRLCPRLPLSRGTRLRRHPFLTGSRRVGNNTSTPMASRALGAAVGNGGRLSLQVRPACAPGSRAPGAAGARPERARR